MNKPDRQEGRGFLRGGEVGFRDGNTIMFFVHQGCSGRSVQAASYESGQKILQSVRFAYQ